jgi:hypothetical protein
MSMIAEKPLEKTQAFWFIELIKPAAPLLACVIRRVFFARTYRLVEKEGRGDLR